MLSAYRCTDLLLGRETYTVATLRVFVEPEWNLVFLTPVQQSDALHFALMRQEIPDRIVLTATIVPHGHRPFIPKKPTRVFRWIGISTGIFGQKPEYRIRSGGCLRHGRLKPY